MRRLALWLCGFCVGATAAPPELRVETQMTDQNTGTMHYVDRLGLRYGGAELVLTSNAAEGVLRPVPGPQHPVGEHDVVLLGWSSWGGGMMAVHAMLIHADGDSIALTGELTFTGDRHNTSFIVRRDGEQRVLLGIPQPPQAVHEPDDWALNLGTDSAEPLKIDAIRQLPFVETERRPTDAVYTVNLAPRGKPPARVAWIAATASGFSIVDAPR
jgi:hypothetical protein